MKYQVFLTQEAENDITNIYDYVAENDSSLKADKLFQKLKETCIRLESLPKRGHVPPELKRIDVIDYLEIHYKPYRVIYQIIEKSVFIHCIIDGKRNLQDLLLARLIGKPD